MTQLSVSNNITKTVLKINDNNRLFWNTQRALSFDLFLYIIMGGRGIGKTTGFLIDVIREHINTGNEFIYMRRYKNEIKGFKKKNPIKKIIDGCEYVADGLGGYTIMYKKKVMGYLVALSVAQEYKSADFSKVDKIGYDEAILKPKSPQKYLAGEVEDLLEFISTVYRLRTKGKVFIFGNNLNLFNPYTAYFNIPTFQGDYYIDKNRGVYFEVCKSNPNLRVEEEKTPFFKLVNGTAYGDYHYENEVLTDVTKNTMEKPLDCKILCRFKMYNDTINVYYFTKDKDTWLYAERKDKDINDDITYTIFNKQGNPNYYDMSQVRIRFKSFLEMYYYKGNIGYNDDKCAGVVSAIMDLI